MKCRYFKGTLQLEINFLEKTFVCHMGSAIFYNDNSHSQNLLLKIIFFLGRGYFVGFHKFMSNIQHCFICRPSDFSVLADARFEPRAVAELALAARRSNHKARSHLI